MWKKMLIFKERVGGTVSRVVRAWCVGRWRCVGTTPAAADNMPCRLVRPVMWSGPLAPLTSPRLENSTRDSCLLSAQHLNNRRKRPVHLRKQSHV